LNCRRVNSLLSAYIDSELTGEEMLAIRAHLDVCPSCRLEHQTLSETKRLVASLALKTPRAELERLLLTDLGRPSRPVSLPALSRFIPPVNQAVSQPDMVDITEGFRVRPRTLAVTALLSLAGLWLASASLDGPRDGHGRTVYANLPPSALMVLGGGRSPVTVPRAEVMLRPSGTVLYASPRVLTPITLSVGEPAPQVPVWNNLNSPTMLLRAGWMNYSH
jgi:anti-sigma factor RsiW